MLSRTNMAKSSYQLHNGQATWLRSKQHHYNGRRMRGVHVCIYCMCVHAHTCNLFIIDAGACVCTLVYVCFWKGVNVCVPREF